MDGCASRGIDCAWRGNEGGVLRSAVESAMDGGVEASRSGGGATNSTGPRGGKPVATNGNDASAPGAAPNAAAGSHPGSDAPFSQASDIHIVAPSRSPRQGAPSVTSSPDTVVDNDRNALEERVRGSDGDDDELLAVAEVRAQQQGQCRETMLDLIKEFGDAMSLQRRLGEQMSADSRRMEKLRGERAHAYERVQTLQGENDGLRDQLIATEARMAKIEAERDELRKRDEERKIEMWREKFFQHKGVFAAVLLSSRDDAPLGILNRSSFGNGRRTVAACCRARTESDFDESIARGRSKTLSQLQRQRTLSPKSAVVTFAALDSTANEDESRLDEGEESEEEEEDGEEEENGEGAAICSRTEGDNITLRWILQFWARHVRSDDVQAERRARSESAHSQQSLREQANFDADARRKQTASDLEQLQRYEQERSHRILLEEELRKEQEEMTKERQQFVDDRDKWLAERQKLTDTLNQSRSEISRITKEAEDLRHLVSELEAAACRKEEESNLERQALKVKLEDVQNRLAQAEATARKIQMMSRKKAEKNSVNEEFAELIAELESIRARISVLDHERGQALERNAWLQRKLDSNQREHDKERQFLPLLHTLRGPIGPQNPTLRRTLANASASEGNLPKISEAMRQTGRKGNADSASMRQAGGRLLR
jgi:hypothetical protein